MRIIATLLLFALLATGCATRGGWPCWRWQHPTDQDNERYATTNQVSAILPPLPPQRSVTFSRPAVIVPSVKSVRLTWNANPCASNETSEIQSCTDLAHPIWVTEYSGPAITNELWIDTNNSAAKFYRAVNHL